VPSRRARPTDVLHRSGVAGVNLGAGGGGTDTLLASRLTPHARGQSGKRDRWNKVPGRVWLAASSFQAEKGGPGVLALHRPRGTTDALELHESRAAESSCISRNWRRVASSMGVVRQNRPLRYTCTPVRRRAWGLERRASRVCRRPGSRSRTGARSRRGRAPRRCVSRPARRTHAPSFCKSRSTHARQVRA
jgi:hypothetical protein